MQVGLMIAWLNKLAEENEDPEIDYAINVIIEHLRRVWDSI